MGQRESDRPMGSDAIGLEDLVNFTENPEPRCACLLLLDTSESMSIRVSLVPVELSSESVVDGVVVGIPKETVPTVVPIDELNDGIEAYKTAVEKDPLASLRVETAIVTFDSRVTVVQDFATVDQLAQTRLRGSGETSMAKGIDDALDLLERRKQAYRESGIAYYRPWLVLITDGKSTDSPEEMSAAADRIRRAEEGKHLAFFSVGVEGADMEELGRLTPRGAMPLKGYEFGEFFKWLSTSLSTVSSSRADDEINLPDVSGWAKL